MGTSRDGFRIRGLRTGSVIVGLGAALLIFGQAGAAHAPVASSASAAVSTLTPPAPLPQAAEQAPEKKYSAEPFKKLKIKVPAAALRLSPALKPTSYARLAMGQIRYPDGALKLPGRTEPAAPDTGERETLEVGHSVSAPTAIHMAKSFDLYAPADGQAGVSPGFAGLPLVSSAHASDIPAGVEALGGPLSRMPIEGHILFESRDDILTGPAQSQLERLVKTLRGNHATVEIVAYAGEKESKSSEARRLALRRGLAVRSYLMSRGIDQGRITVRPMGGVRDSGPQQRVDVFYASY